jgi:hypothetical protein
VPAGRIERQPGDGSARSCDHRQAPNRHPEVSLSNEEFAMVRSILMAISLLALAGCASSNVEQRLAERIALYERHAGAPVDSIPALRMRGFETLGAQAIVVWSDPSRMYLLSLDRPCFGLELRYTVAVTSSGGFVRPRFDAVTFIEQPSRMLQRCVIESIRPVDAIALRQERRQRRL